MQLTGDTLLLSASDLVGFLDCEHLTSLELARTRSKLERPSGRPAMAEIAAGRGDEHEHAHLTRLQEEGRAVTRIDADTRSLEGLRGAADRTAAAMRAGAEVIFQGVLFDGARWRGTADFLERVDARSDLGGWSYEIVDTKLARSVKAHFLVQLCVYSELLAGVQGRPPDRVHVVLGTRERASFRPGDFAAYVRRVRGLFEDRVFGGLGTTYPDPVAHCAVCPWMEACDERRVADDHLGLVAGMRADQRRRLAGAGTGTVAQLAAADPGDGPPRMNPQTFGALRAQAALQIAQRESGEVGYELLDPAPEAEAETEADPGQEGEPGPPRGFARLPEPSPGDVFFDIEGDPFFEDGLEYLFGVTTVDGDEPRFRAFWATDRAGEREAFERLVDFLIERIDRYPEAHVYHYAPYEPSALKRLMGLHATREDEVDRLLRERRMVDLYPVVRQSMRIGQPSYSLKKVEALYSDRREESVTDAEESIVMFERWLEERDDRILEEIERYNEADCESTWRLREWLLERREEAAERFGRDIPWRARGEPDPGPTDVAAEVGELQAALLDGVPEDPDGRSEVQADRWLLAQLLDYHRREAKPSWWAYFERLDRTAHELCEEDGESLGELSEAADAEPWTPEDAPRSLVHTLDFPPQEHKIGPGSYVDPDGKAVSVRAVDEAAGRVEIVRGANRRDEPLPRAIVPGGPYDTEKQRGALREIGADVASRGLDAQGRFGAARSLLRRTPPRTSAVEQDTPLQEGPFDLAEASRIAGGLSNSNLFIQGPPGSGKTYSGGRLVVDLLRQGRRVGVSSSSHRAINNLLGEVEECAISEGLRFRGAKKISKGSDAYEPTGDDPMIVNETGAEACAAGDFQLIAGTAWLFCREEWREQLDVLLIDEAGQVSLADALALSTAADSVVLLGDPQQLGQVSQALHPPGAGRSVLEHLLGEDQTVRPDRGLFMDRTRRMHPDVCAFVSEVVYEGRLTPLPDCERQRVESASELTGTGLRWLALPHEANVRRSEEEAEAIAAAAERLLDGGKVTEADGSTRALAAEDLMVVAPYNAQVRCLAEHLPAGVRAGTVDKFQGLEAQVVFFSMATSSGAEVPRNLEFLFSRNRLNVAISRARCLAVLVASPELLHTRCRNAEQMRLVNALCRFVEMAEEVTVWEAGEARGS